MIRDDFKVSSKQVMPKVLDAPYNSQAFQLGRSVISLTSVGSFAEVQNRVFPSLVIIFRQYCSKYYSNSIHVESEEFIPVRSCQYWLCEECNLDIPKGFSVSYFSFKFLVYP